MVSATEGHSVAIERGVTDRLQAADQSLAAQLAAGTPQALGHQPGGQETLQAGEVRLHLVATLGDGIAEEILNMCRKDPTGDYRCD